MSAIVIGFIIVLFILLLVGVGYAFYLAFSEFGAKEVLFTLFISAVVIGAILLSSFITNKLGEVKCDYNSPIIQKNFTTGKEYVAQPPFYRCYFDFFGTQSSTEDFIMRCNETLIQ